MRKLGGSALVAASAVPGWQGVVAADAVPVSGTGSLGGFSGTFGYTPLSSASGIVQVLLTNTSPAANGGCITAFVFKLPPGAPASARDAG